MNRLHFDAFVNGKQIDEVSQIAGELKEVAHYWHILYKMFD